MAFIFFLEFVLFETVPGPPEDEEFPPELPSEPPGPPLDESSSLSSSELHVFPELLIDSSDASFPAAAAHFAYSLYLSITFFLSCYF